MLNGKWATETYCAYVIVVVDEPFGMSVLGRKLKLLCVI
jgi:hypothetical protein